MKNTESLFRTIILVTLVIGMVVPSVIRAQVADSLPNINKVYIPSLKTVIMCKDGFEMSAPLINLTSGQNLKLSFDDLDPVLKHFRYTIRHCEANWSTSADLTPQDYIEGFTDDEISDFAYSYNTTTPYIHYSLIFPRGSLKPKLSGNYIVIVYLDDPSDVVFTWRFMIAENSLLSITGNVHQSNTVSDHYTKQQVDFTVEYNGMQISDPAREIKVVVTQNDRQDNVSVGIAPRFIRGQSLDFTDASQCMFNGGNEFRSFDIKSLLYQSEKVRRIEFIDKAYHVFLVDDTKRPFKNYATEKDINGRKLIKNEEHAQNSDIEADYAYVHFFLPSEVPLAGGKVFILGAVTDWQLNDSSSMNYNYQWKGYEKTLFVKQGYYNYLYVVKDNRSGKYDESIIEGNHWETENEYTIWVYYHPGGGQYDRLISTSDLNSIH